MNITLKKLNESGYKDYQRCMKKIEYSFNKIGEPVFFSTKQICNATFYAIMSKPEFIEEVKKTEVRFYCLKDEENNNIGIAIISYKGKICKIHEFSVFEHHKGIGTIFYKMLLNEIKDSWPMVKELKCICPFEGAQIFWEKQGFNRVKGFFEYWRMMPK